jgi:hypothetical protein
MMWIEGGGTMPTAIRIKRVRLSQRFVRQLQISVPLDWLKEHELAEGDFIDLMKDTEGRLIVIPVKAARA